MDEIRQAVKSEAETTVRLLNYRKNGEPFWNMFTIAPMADADGKNRFFIGIQVRSVQRTATARQAYCTLLCSSPETEEQRER